MYYLRNNRKQNKNDKTTRESNTTNNENEIMAKSASDLQYANSAHFSPIFFL